MSQKAKQTVTLVSQILRTKSIRYLLIVALLVIIIFPLVNILFIFPQFTIAEAERDAHHLAEHINVDFFSDVEELTPAVITGDLSQRIQTHMADFKLADFKIFGPAGEILYANNQAEIGTTTSNNNFYTYVAQGEIFSKLVRRNSETVDGVIFQQDVVEIYVPIMRNGRFLGAYEIYYDITTILDQLAEVNRRGIIALILIGIILLGVIGILAYRIFISEDHLRQLHRAVECSPNAVMITDDKFVVIYANAALTAVTGQQPEQVLKRPLQITPNQHLNGTLQSIRTSIAAKGIWQTEKQNRRPNGTRYWENIIISPVQNEAGKTTNYIILREDITAKKQAQDALRRQIQYFKSLVSASPIAIVILDMNGRITDYNHAFVEMFGFENVKLIGQKLDDLIGTPENNDEMRHYTNQVIHGQLIRGISKRKRHNGDIIDVEIYGVPVIVDDEQIGVLGLYQDVTKRIEYENSLRQAKQAAEEATHAKSEFLANMSHEIRTPLNGVIGMTGLLLDTPLTKEQREFVETIRTSGDALLTIINDILDFSKIEAGRLELEKAPFNLSTCIEEVLDLLAPQASKKKLELAYLMNGRIPPILLGDVTRLRQILVNLIGNAIKFTAKGEVIVSVMGQMINNNRYQLYFAVKDTGIGIPKEKMSRLFQSFSQVDASTTRRYGGTGLGLAISKRLAEMMGGSMWVDSQVGEGSTFHFSIQVETTQEAINQIDNLPISGLQGKNILIVDDNDTNLFILSHQVKNWGMEPTIFANGANALTWLKQGHPCDIAVLDMQMPEMDGLTLASEIRKFRPADDLPLVMFSSLGNQPKESRQQLFEAFLTKPIKPSQLQATISHILSQKPIAQAKSKPSMTIFDAELAKKHPLHILLAEDNVINQKVALRMLERLGYRADVAANGMEAIDALERQHYDVVLMDVQMPEMDGVAATKAIRRRWQKDDTPWIIALTANALAGDREKYLACGMNDYISKPVKPEELMQALTAVPRKHPASYPNGQKIDG
ncbi:MAG: hypothetical protein Kow0080_16870 [Candidatus Promineifilaceae bacterium]